MSSNEVDYYLLLEVNSSASATEIKKAFHRLAFIHHPDRNINDAGANERFRKINEAYQVLADVTKRNRYDQQRENFFYIPSQEFVPFIYAEINQSKIKRNEEVALTFAFGSEGRFFKRPEIPGCYITSGPIVNHRINTHNGIALRETLLTYTVCPMIIGKIIIPSATINYDRNKVASNELHFYVEENYCYFKKDAIASVNPAKIFLNCQRVTSNSIYRKTIIHQRTVLIPRSELAAWYHKVGRAMKIGLGICGGLWAMLHHQSILLGFVLGSFLAGINCWIMYWMMGIKPLFYYSINYPRVKEYLKEGYSLGVSPSNFKTGNKIWYLIKTLFS